MNRSKLRDSVQARVGLGVKGDAAFFEGERYMNSLMTLYVYFRINEFANVGVSISDSYILQYVCLLVYLFV